MSFRITDPPKKSQDSHLMDLLDISFGATSISSQPSNTSGMGAGAEPWGMGATALSQPDPWSGDRDLVSPPIASDPWVPSKSNSASPALKVDPWRMQPPPSSNDGFNSSSNGNGGLDPWLGKASALNADPWTSPKPADPWAPNASNDLTRDFGVTLPENLKTFL